MQLSTPARNGAKVLLQMSGVPWQSEGKVGLQEKLVQEWAGLPARKSTNMASLSAEAGNQRSLSARASICTVNCSTQSLHLAYFLLHSN